MKTVKEKYLVVGADFLRPLVARGSDTLPACHSLPFVFDFPFVPRNIKTAKRHRKGGALCCVDKIDA